jgi:hypothetical protein
MVGKMKQDKGKHDEAGAEPGSPDRALRKNPAAHDGRHSIPFLNTKSQIQ